MAFDRPRLDIELPEVIADDADAQQVEINKKIEAFADTLAPETWFEVWYPGDTEESYDVVRVGAEGIVTLDVLASGDVNAQEVSA